MGYLYKVCQERTRFIKKIVKQFEEIWEHEWDELVKDQIDVKDFILMSLRCIHSFQKLVHILLVLLQ